MFTHKCTVTLPLETGVSECATESLHVLHVRVRSFEPKPFKPLVAVSLSVVAIFQASDQLVWLQGKGCFPHSLFFHGHGIAFIMFWCFHLDSDLYLKKSACNCLH